MLLETPCFETTKITKSYYTIIRSRPECPHTHHAYTHHWNIAKDHNKNEPGSQGMGELYMPSYMHRHSEDMFKVG